MTSTNAEDASKKQKRNVMVPGPPSPPIFIPRSLFELPSASQYSQEIFPIIMQNDQANPTPPTISLVSMALLVVEDFKLLEDEIADASQGGNVTAKQ